MLKTFDLAAALAAAHVRPIAADLTLFELVSSFTIASAGDYVWRLRKWTDAFGSTSAWAITSEQLELAANAMLEHGYKPATVNRDLSALGTCYRWAKQKALSPRGFRSPTLDVRRFDESIRRIEVSRQQIETLRASALSTRDRRFGCFVHLLIDTGARKSELLERRWKDVDLDAGTILCGTTKTGVPRILHFRAETAELMRRVWKTRPEDALLFSGRIPEQPVSFRKAWAVVTHEAGLPLLHMHDLRHAAAADLLRSGVTIGVAAQVLGHSPQILSRRYGHLETEALRAAQERRWRATT